VLAKIPIHLTVSRQNGNQKDKTGLKASLKGKKKTADSMYTFKLTTTYSFNSTYIVLQP